MPLRDDYEVRFRQVLEPLASAIECQLRDYMDGQVRVDRIQARAKSVDRFVNKAEKVDDVGNRKYQYPLVQIQDQVGARITVFYLSDVPRISEIVELYFRQAEAREILPESEWEFGYFGKHYVLLVPKELKAASWPSDSVPSVFELQIKTLFQHAWSEAEHDLDYKPGGKALAADDRRMLAFTSAQAWGADHIFDELFRKSQS